ncbi:cytochrome c [Robiginitalea sp. SC105]|uniref:c-type cytochrome n=1 Tax=Robiginitalea sp. SC105 TaxID=2762332 RepID=UPI001639C1A1|nr:cytochrome c [Robiginitalea sp. SC105]MBC2839294.1 cytochrome c [Robiginitalea sp. SC105]
MKRYMKYPTLLLVLLIMSCGGKEEKKNDGFEMQRKSEPAAAPATTPEPGVNASERVALDNKGVGPVQSVTLDPDVDTGMAAEGEKIYNQMCLACHKIGKRFIGPPPNGILERRTPEWVMNMILNPEVMVKEDPLARDLLMEFNGSPMANQGLTEEQARAVLEYFRTLE